MLETGSRPVSEERLGALAQLLRVSVPWLRYGIAETIDTQAIAARERAEGWRDAMMYVRAQLQQFVDEHTPPTPRRTNAKPSHARSSTSAPRRAPRRK